MKNRFFKKREKDKWHLSIEIGRSVSEGGTPRPVDLGQMPSKPE
jgi:hypothetical protein